MTRDLLLGYLRQNRYCVQSTNSPDGPQSAVVGFAIRSGFEIVFDTLSSTRKVRNLRRDPRMSLVIGWDDEQTAQIEGLADEPSGSEVERLKSVYFTAWPDGREREKWPGITYVRLRPRWIRYSDFRAGGSIVEFSEF